MMQKQSQSWTSRVFLTHERLIGLLEKLGVSVYGETETDIMCFCPFHHNRDSPAFNISKYAPYKWKCWNGKCAQKGNIYTLLTKKGYGNREAKQMLLEGLVDVDEFIVLLKQLVEEEKRDDDNEWSNFDHARFRMEDESHDWPARKYLEGRGIERAAYDYFSMGFSYKKRMLVVPIFSEFNELAGVVGRSIEAKRYHYSSGLDRNNIIWNLNNAKHFDKIILTEGALDSVYIWQAGYKSVGAVFGSSVSESQVTKLRNYFGEIVCFFDNDEAGNALRDSIIRNIKDISVSYVSYPEREVKDPGDLTTEEINWMIDNRTSSLQAIFGE